MNEFALLLAATIASGTTVALAGLGLLLNEKAGVLNLGAEGMMLMAAVAGFAAALATGSDLLAFGVGALVGGVAAAVFGVLVIWLNTNQYATGLALSLFGAGLSAFIGQAYTGKKLEDQAAYEVPVLADLPFFGDAFFKQHPMAYATVALVLLCAWFLYRTRWATRCAGSVWPRWWPAARCAAWRGPFFRWSMRRCGSRGWWLAGVGSPWR